jgi:hypothetical protein
LQTLRLREKNPEHTMIPATPDYLDDENISTTVSKAKEKEKLNLPKPWQINIAFILVLLLMTIYRYVVITYY